MTTLDGVVPELRKRIEGVITDANGKCWIGSAFRTRAQQQHLYDLHQKDPVRFAAANLPGTSKHETGEAVDVDCDPANNKIRADLAARWQLVIPHSTEPWHMELPTGISSGVDVATSQNDNDGDDDMAQQPDDIVSEYRWQTGEVVRLLRDGGVRNYGGPFSGNIHTVLPKDKLNWSDGPGVVAPVNPNDMTAGYVIYDWDANFVGRFDRSWWDANKNNPVS